MRIGIDAREMQRPFTGTGMYVVELIKGLAAIDPHNQYFLFVEEGYKPLFELPDNFTYTWLKPSRIPKFQDQVIMKKAISHAGLDVFHVTHHDVTPFLTTVPLVVTVLDIAWIDLVGDSSTLFRKYYYAITKSAVRKACRIVTISVSTRDRVLHHFPTGAKKIEAVPIACDPAYDTTPQPDVFRDLSAEFNLQKSFVLYVGSFAGRKNLSLLINAMEIVWTKMPGVQLILAGKPSGRDDTRFGNETESRPIITISRPKSQVELQALYANAAMLVFPSLYEGFGLPVLEAMSSGCAVITSNTTSLPEIAGDAGIQVNPYDVTGLATQIIDLLNNSAKQQQLREAGLIQAKHFNWNKVAQATLHNYQATLDTEHKTN